MALRLFDFFCKNCAHTLEEYIDTDQKEMPDCPSCKVSKLEKVLQFGGYKVYGDNSGSTKSRWSGAFKRPKAKADKAPKKKKPKKIRLTTKQIDKLIEEHSDVLDDLATLEQLKAKSPKNKAIRKRVEDIINRKPTKEQIEELKTTFEKVKK